MSLTVTYYEPDESMGDYVSTYWMIENTGQKDDITLLPDAHFELIVSKDEEGEFEVWLTGLNTTFENNKHMPVSRMFGISFRLLASEYIFKHPIADIANSARKLPSGFWGFTESDLEDVSGIIKKAEENIRRLMPEHMDHRKKLLSDLIYRTNGGMPVQELAGKSCWTPRQINRYFNYQFGISLKSYCTFLRFRSSYEQLIRGKLSPEQNYADQAHFIREVKKMSGVSPKQLSRNENDRFIQFLKDHPE